MEGATEQAFKPHLERFLRDRLAGNMPKLAFHQENGRVPTGAKLRRVVERLSFGKQRADHVIALTDVYTGSNEFVDAADAKRKMREWVGNESRFHPHAAQHDFEAWLIPYWSTIQRLAGHSKGAPGGAPESVNHGNPPSERIKEVFRMGSCSRHYSKRRDASGILRNQDLTLSAMQCPELRAFLNTILRVSGGESI